MLKSFGNRLALVGISTDDTTPVGEWVEREFYGIKHLFFSIGKLQSGTQKPLIPMRFSVFIKIKKFRKKILSLNIKNAFVQSPELLIATASWDWNSLCFIFHGVKNPLEMPRYKWGIYLKHFYNWKVFSALNKADLILACADEESIDELIKESKGRLRKNITQFATRVDTDIYFPVDREIARSILEIPIDLKLIVNIGRINKVKGWDFLLESFQKYLEKSNSKAIFKFIGDGEDRTNLQDFINVLSLQDAVQITGFLEPSQVALYINASDLCVVGSYFEGWSISILEALACGKPIVSTDVSGARQLILDGKNGFVSLSRNPVHFAELMSLALEIKDAKSISLDIVNKFSLKSLPKDLGDLWKPLS